MAKEFKEINLSEDFWDDQEREVFALLLKPAEHYLVYASGCRWNGASGYKIVDSIFDICYRDYDAAIYPVSKSRGGKILMCEEYSHDVPQGSETYVIALTQKEFEKLNNPFGIEFSQVQDFVNFHIKKGEKI